MRFIYRNCHGWEYLQYVRTIAVILTCFNRRDTTLACLDRLQNQTAVAEELGGHEASPAASLEIFLVDDGSTDGTAEAVRSSHPDVNIIEGTGDLFWNRGMHLAWSTAIESGGFDHYFLLNDDTILFTDALEQLIRAAEHPERGSKDVGIAVGATTDPETGEFTYGGYVRASKWNPMKLRHRMLSETDQIDTMNCNAVLVPSAVVDTIGQMDPTYHHSWGDIDLGYRASKAGFTLSVPSVPIGHCEPNPKGTDGHHNIDLSLRERVTFINSIRGLNKSDWLHLVRQHGGPVWPVVWASPYINLFVTWGRQKLGRS